MIKGNVVGQKLCADFPYIVGGSIDYLTAEFTFSDEWKGLDIWAHFSHGGTTYDIRLKDGKIEREDHLNLSDGHWHLYLHGTKEGMRITTNEVLFVVDESGAINGEPLPEIPLSAAEQIALDASDAREIAASVRKDADDGVFDGKPFTYEDFTPEQLAGLKGETGDTGATGVGVLSVEQTVKSNEDDGENQFEITLTNGDTYTFGVKNGSKGSTGETGATGATGETGVGIKSVEQTVVSTEDDGVNVFTITLTNDEQYTVEVRNGSKGIQGDKGDTGVGIESVKQTSTSTEDDGENVVTVRLTNGVEETLTFKNGSKGSQGIQGVQGVQGIQGESGKDGASVTVSNVSESTADGGNNIVTFSDGKTLTVKNGSKGSKGDKGDKGADGTMTFEDLTPEQKESLRGDQGIQGERGADGTSVTIASVTESTEDSGSNVVTFSDGKALIVKNGSKGSKGDKGDRGEAGQGFEISKTYASVAAMNAGYATDGVPINGFVLIETGNVEDADNAKLFVKLETGYSYLTDLSGAQGIKGERGEAGSDGKDGTSVMVANVTESSEDGGANVVVFSDGKSVTVKNGHRGSQGEKGETGAAGSNGVSVSSVVQTTTSSADGGENIITVTLSNGEKFTFSVKNGNKGSQGIQGEQGIQGIQGVQGIQGESGKDGTSVTVSNVSESTADGGNNIVTFSDGKTLTVKNGSKGSKGDTGEVDYSRLNGYLPLSGGTMTGAIALPNNIALKSKNNAGVEQEMIRANGSNQIVIGANGLWELLVLYHGIVPATSAVDTLDVGNADRRWRNLYISGVLSDGTNRITIANIANKSDIPSSLPASDVYDWAKAESKPTYTASEVGARPNTWTPSASEVGAAASSHNQAASTITAGTFAGQVVANSSGQAAGTSLLRNSKLVSAETNPTVNGEICWTYG